MQTETLTKVELKRQVKRFLQDPNRGISLELFAELCGCSKDTLQNVFVKETDLLSEYIQRRVSKGYQAWRRGEVAIMKNRDNTRFVQYRKEPKPALKRSMGLQLEGGQIKIKVGIANKFDYSQPSLKEQLGDN